MIAPIGKADANVASVAKYLVFGMNGADFCADVHWVHAVVRPHIRLAADEAAPLTIVLGGRKVPVFIHHVLPSIRPDALHGPHFIVVFNVWSKLSGLLVDDVEPRIGEACREAEPDGALAASNAEGTGAIRRLVQIGGTWCVMLDVHRLMP